MRVWILLKGELHEGGHVEAVYGTKAAAEAAFAAEAADLLKMWQEVYEGRPETLKGLVNVQYPYAAISCDTITVVTAEVE